MTDAPLSFVKREDLKPVCPHCEQEITEVYTRTKGVPFIQGTNNGGKRTKKRYTQTIFRDWCKCCGICVAFCPKGVIVSDENDLPRISDSDLCIGCRFCELHCPDFAITVRRKEDLAESVSHVPRSSK